MTNDEYVNPLETVSSTEDVEEITGKKLNQPICPECRSLNILVWSEEMDDHIFHEVMECKNCGYTETN